MRKYTQRELKGFVREGMAQDITNHDNAAREALEAREGMIERVRTFL